MTGRAFWSTIEASLGEHMTSFRVCCFKVVWFKAVCYSQTLMAGVVAGRWRWHYGKHKEWVKYCIQYYWCGIVHSQSGCWPSTARFRRNCRGQQMLAAHHSFWELQGYLDTVDGRKVCRIKHARLDVWDLSVPNSPRTSPPLFLYVSLPLSLCLYFLNATHFRLRRNGIDSESKGQNTSQFLGTLWNLG